LSHDKIIEVSDLHKAYKNTGGGSVQAVKSISFYVDSGKLFAFLGPNGAGKSTTIDILCTFLKPDTGSIIINGYKLGKEDDEIRKCIGAVFQDGLLDDLLTVEENVRTRGSFYGLRGNELDKAVKAALNAVGITELAKRRYGKLSGGQRRRCDIARALVNTPKILFLDEPTTGLDPQTRKSVWDTILRLQKETDMTVFLTTHYMEEAAEADYVIIIDHGNIAAKGTPAELREKYASDRLTLISRDAETLTNILNANNISFATAADRFIVSVDCTLAALPVIDLCRSYISGFEVTAGTMDDAFIGITGKEIR
jgi:multidrug/hemolysin transport system ATP-binding protein